MCEEETEEVETWKVGRVHQPRLALIAEKEKQRKSPFNSHNIKKLVNIFNFGGLQC